MTACKGNGESVHNGSIAGRVAIVTGAATGLGAAIARELNQAGARVVLADIDRLLACALADTIDPGRNRSLVVTCDITRAEDCVSVVQQSIDRFGTIDIVVNCAGTDISGPLHALALDEWNRVLGTNVRGPFLLCEAAREALLVGFDGAGGHVVNVSATGADQSWSSLGAYHASKLGLLGFTHALHAEMQQHGIRVSSVIDGGIAFPPLPLQFKGLDPDDLQDPADVALAVMRLLQTPRPDKVPEVMVLPAARPAAADTQVGCAAA